ncbi:MAG: hypothetical protein WDZ30_04055 [Cellvibrionaceae bacterium]
MSSKTSITVDESKRSFIKQASYITPAVVTLAAIPSFASAGSGYRRPKGNEGLGNGYDGPPPGHNGTNYNDFEGTSPGNPGHRHPQGK